MAKQAGPKQGHACTHTSPAWWATQLGAVPVTSTTTTPQATPPTPPNVPTIAQEPPPRSSEGTSRANSPDPSTLSSSRTSLIPIPGIRKNRISAIRSTILKSAEDFQFTFDMGIVQKEKLTAMAVKKNKNLSPAATITVEQEAHFRKVRHELVCPACRLPNGIKKNGSSKTTPPRPQYKCKCNATYTFTAMEKLLAAHVTPPPDMATAVSVPNPPPTSPDTGEEMHTDEPPAVLPTAPSMPLVFEHHVALPEYMQTIMEVINATSRRVDQLESLLAENQQLKDQLATAQTTIAAMQLKLDAQSDASDALIVKLPLDAPGGTAASKYATAATAKENVCAPAPLTWADRVQKNSPSTQNKNKNKRILTPRRAAAVSRVFGFVSGDQGFKYMYIPSKFRLPTKDLRSRLRQLGFDNARLLDVHYPDRQVVAILLHNDYVEEFTTLLAKHRIPVIEDFDPCDPKHLRDPKLAALSEEERHEKAAELHKQRLLKAIAFIREPVKYAIARAFTANEWFTPVDLQSILPAQKTKPANPTTTSHPFVTEPSMHVDVEGTKEIQTEPIDDEHMSVSDSSSSRTTPITNSQ